MPPSFEDNTPLSERTRQVRVISRLAPLAMLSLFVRTLLWVLDGVFFTNPAELRLYSVGVFLIGGFSLWQILDLKAFARRLFICVASLTWGIALVTLIRADGLPLMDASSIQMAEYAAFTVWIVVSVVFVIYLMQPRVRSAFTVSASNPYGRALFAIALGHLLFFEWNSMNGLVGIPVKLAPSWSGQSVSLERFQSDCNREESSRIPSGDERAVEKFCRCDSKLLGERCPTTMAVREQCVRHIQVKLADNPKGKLFFQQAREACVSESFPMEQQAIFQKARASLERSVLQRLSIGVPLEKVVSGEVGQRKFLYCMSLGLFSRCRDPKPSATQVCLTKIVEPSEAKVLKTRCLRLAFAKYSDYETLLAVGESHLVNNKPAEAIAAAAHAIASAGNRPEAYLVRGIGYAQTNQDKNAVDDLTTALKISDFSHSRVRALETRRLAYVNLKDVSAAELDAKEACALGDTALCPQNGAGESAAWHSSEEVAVAMAKAISGETTAERAPSAQLPAAVAGVTDENRRIWNELVQVGGVALAMGDAAKALDKFQQALILTESLGAGNELWRDSSLRLAAFLRGVGRVSEGELHLRNTFAQWAKLGEAGQRLVVEEVGRYSTFYQGRKEWMYQERILLELWKAASDSDSLLVREINLYLSQLYQASGRPEKLGVFFKREVEIYQKRFGKKDARLDISRDRLNDYYRRNGDFPKVDAVLASP